MKILAVSDEECAALWDYYVPGRLKEYDLILSCGDLKPDYLSFLVTMGRAPVLYVHGNHDGCYDRHPPEGCDCIDGQFVVYNGLRILGLGGCRKYHPGPHQYTEREMRRRIRRLAFQLWRHKGVDIVVTHAPPLDLGDGSDPAHWGFQALRDLIEKYRPLYLVHGHVHPNYGDGLPRTQTHGVTRIINAYERYVIDIPDRPYPAKQAFQVTYKTRQRKRDD